MPANKMFRGSDEGPHRFSSATSPAVRIANSAACQPLTTTNQATAQKISNRRNVSVPPTTRTSENNSTVLTTVHEVPKMSPAHNRTNANGQVRMNGVPAPDDAILTMFQSWRFEILRRESGSPESTVCVNLEAPIAT